MIYSMTGFGAAEKVINGFRCKAELRCVNSKHLDITLKLPAPLKHLEYAIRKYLQAIQRGKVECILTLDNTVPETGYINRSLLQAYIQELKAIARENEVAVECLLNGVLLIPGIIHEQPLSEELFTEQELEPLLLQAIHDLDQYRMAEGSQLMADLRERIISIKKYLASILPYEQERIQKIKEKIIRELGSVAAELQADTSRLEMEMIFYLEKLDINEEKVRLIAHCDYFEKIMSDLSEKEKGKKLGFLAQEMGREINTIGSKANHSLIQHQVVLMKEEVEKIKEQVNNIL